MPPKKNTSDWSAHKGSGPRSSKEFIQARIDSIISSRLLGQTEEQSASEADQLNNVKQREQEQHIDLSGTKSTQDQEDIFTISYSCSSQCASNLSADVADMVKRLKMRQQQQQREQSEHVVLTGTKHPRYREHPFGEIQIFGEEKKNRMSAAFCEGCLRKQGACLCQPQQQREQDEHKVLTGAKHPRYREHHPGETHIFGEAKKNRMSATFYCDGCLHRHGSCLCNESHHVAIEICDDPEAVETSVSMHNQNLFADAVDDNTESTLDDVRLEGIEHAVESAGINQLVTAKVKKKTKSLIAVEVNEENNDSHQHTETFRWRAFVVVALLLLIVSILIGLLFALARPRRTQP